MDSTERTLVKSQPELWRLLEQPERLEGWMSALLGHGTEIRISDCDPERFLAWEGAVADERARIEIEMEQSGWGTNVTVRASGGPTANEFDGWAEALIEELAEPQRRPFRNGL